MQPIQKFVFITCNTLEDILFNLFYIFNYFVYTKISKLTKTKVKHGHKIIAQ